MEQSREKELLIRDKYNGVIPTDEQSKAKFAKDLERLAAGEPLAYVIGWIPFLGLKIQLNSRALIPRPETEWWTEKLIAHLEHMFGNEPFEMLDLCAGSGAIGLAVLHALPNAFVSFGEIDPAHSASIEQTMYENNLDSDRASIHTGNLFAPFADEQFDIIATNPPYIPTTRTLDVSVLSYEPHQALFSGADGLNLIRVLLADAPMYLVPQGELWIECDTNTIEEVQKIALAAGYSEPTIHDDLYGRPRLLVSHFE